MGYAQVKMSFRNQQLPRSAGRTRRSGWKKTVESLPAVFSTPAGVFTFSAADSTLQTIQPVPEVIQAAVVSPNAAAASYRNRLAVSPSSKSTTIAQLTFTSSQESRGVDFLNKLVELYNEEGNNDKNEVAAKTAEFIDERIRIINKELGTTESQLASFKQRAGVVDIAADASQAATEQAGYERAYAENEVQISLVNHLKNHILSEKSQYEVIPANIGLNNSDLNTVVQNYNQMLIERKRLLRTSHEDNPAVQSLNASIEVMRNSVMGPSKPPKKAAYSTVRPAGSDPQVCRQGKRCPCTGKRIPQHVTPAGNPGQPLPDAAAETRGKQHHPGFYRQQCPRHRRASGRWQIFPTPHRLT